MKKTDVLRILLLEDNEDDIFLIENILKADGMNMEIRSVDTREDYLIALKEFTPDVILSDHGLPQFNSTEALRISQQELELTPFLIVTGTMSEEFAVLSLKEGADDYLLKSNLMRLPMAIRGAINERQLQRQKVHDQRALKKQNAELVRLNDELIRANAELDQFVYSVSHNLRGPLSSVMGLIQLARIEGTDVKIQSIHNMIEQSMFKLDHTLREILDYSRNARGSVSHEEIRWGEIIHETIEKLSFHPLDDIIWEIQVQDDVTVYSDRERIGVILQSLISNAIIFRDKGETSKIQIHVLTNGEVAEVSVTDNGNGIRAEFLPRVFDMFYRGSEKSQGAGLGLYIAKEIARVLGGTLSIDSVVNTFTKVTLTLPNTRSGGGC